MKPAPWAALMVVAALSSCGRDASPNMQAVAAEVEAERREAEKNEVTCHDCENISDLIDNMIADPPGADPPD